MSFFRSLFNLESPIFRTSIGYLQPEYDIPVDRIQYENGQFYAYICHFALRDRGSSSSPLSFVHAPGESSEPELEPPIFRDKIGAPRPENELPPVSHVPIDHLDHEFQIPTACAEN